LINNLKYSLRVLFLLIIFNACKNPIPYDKGQFVLWKNDFKGNQSVIKEELEQIIPFSQKENSKPFGLPITPRVWWYNFGLKRFNPIKNEIKMAAYFEKLNAEKKQIDQSSRKIQKLERKIDRKQENLDEKNAWLWRNIGEKQVLVNAPELIQTANKINKFLFDKGFRDATTAYDIDTLSNKKKAKVTYTITEGQVYKIDTVLYKISDPTIDSIMKAEHLQARIKDKNDFDLSHVEAEKLRIEQLLKNNGYYEFTNKYITHGATNFEEDEQKFKTEKHGNLKFEILNPENKPKHERFYIDEIVFKAFDPNSNKANRKPDTLIFNDVKFIRLDKTVPPQIITNRILTKPGSFFKVSDIVETQRQIGMFNQFAFASSQLKATSSQTLSLEYFAPLLERYTFGITPGINNIYNDGSTFFGFGVPVSLTARNRFSKLETIEASVRASYEGQPSPINTENQPIRGSLEMGVNLNVTLPSIWFFNKADHQFNLKNPRTILGLGYNYSEPFWGKRLNFKLNTNHSIQLNKYAVLYLSLLDANLINTTYFNNESGQSFYNSLLELQKQGNNLKVTFDPQFVSSFNANYVFNNQNPSRPLSNAKFFRIFLESGGTVLNFLDTKNKIGIIETLFPMKTATNTVDTIRAYFRFVKVNADYRRNINLTTKSSYAYKVNVGVTNPYGSNKSLPFEKNFFIGGSNSIRAWAPRTLGAGSASADTTTAGNTIPQPGDILLESSLEYRRKIFRFAGDIQIAAFLDAGNVWKWHAINTPSKANKANFELNRFFKEIALGTGLGLRWDLSYFLFRFDWGIKVIDPSKPLGSRFVLDEFTLKRNQHYGLNWNFGIGYPF
jgi:outer membrane protein insertion porin family